MASIIYDDCIFYDSENANDKNIYNGNDNNEYSIQHKLDINHFKTLVGSKDYQAAYDYLSQYRFKDPIVQREIDNRLQLMKHNMRETQAIHSRIQNPKTLERVKLGEVVLSGESFDLTGNEYYDDINKSLKYLGSLQKDGNISNVDGNITTEAVGLSVTFPSKANFLQRFFAGDDSFDQFCKNIGFDQQQLIANGIKPIEDEDGNITINFSKNHPLVYKILYSIPSGHSNIGYDENSGAVDYGDVYEKPGNVPTIYNTGQRRISITGIDKNGNKLLTINGNNTANDRYYHRIYRNIQDATSAKIEAYKKANAEEFVHSSVITPMYSDQLASIDEAYKQGRLSDGQYKYYREQYGPERIIKTIKSMGSNIKMYSNYESYKDKKTAETQYEMNSTQRAEIINLISATDIKNIEQSHKLSDGEYGTELTINAVYNDDGKMIRPKLQVFFPGLYSEEAQKALTRNTSSRSLMELTSMIDYGGEYKTEEGRHINYIGGNVFALDGLEIDKNTALKLIHKDMNFSDAKRNLPWKHIGVDGQSIDLDSYNQQALLIAIASTNELYPDIEFKKTDGSAYTINELLSIRGAGNDVTEEGKQTMPVDTYTKVLEFYDFYSKLLDQLNYFNLSNNTSTSNN